jgi:hypothetical protein
LFDNTTSIVLSLGIADESVATIAAGIIGVIIVYFVAVGVAYLRRNRVTAPTSSGS